MTEGWLVLTMDSLCLYDRDPRGVTRKPIHKVMLNEPGVAYLVLPSVSRHTLPHTSPSALVRAFGMQVYSGSQSKELCFLAASVQSKIDWVEAIQKVLSEYICPPVMEESTSQLGSKGGGTRELKSVSIIPLSNTPVPVKGETSGGSVRLDSNQSTPANGNTSSGSGLDLSIRSSMLNSSSDDSFI